MPVIPDDTYRAKPLSPAVLNTTSTGKERISIQFKLIEKPGVTVRWDGYFTEKTKERTLASLRYCGWNGTDLSDVTFPENAEVLVVTETDTYEKDGQTKQHSRVAWVNKPQSGPTVKSQMDGAAAKAFAQKMKGAILAYDLKNPNSNGNSSVPF